MHAYQHGIVGTAFDFFESHFLAFLHGQWGFSAVDGLVEFAISPALQHRIEFLAGMFTRLLSFKNSPVNLIEFGDDLGGDIEGCEGGNGLVGAFQRAHVNALKGDVFVGLEKRVCLLLSE